MAKKGSKKSKEVEKQEEVKPQSEVKSEARVVSLAKEATGRRMVLRYEDLFVTNVVDRGPMTLEEVARAIGMGHETARVMLASAMRSRRYEAKFEGDRYLVASKGDWRKPLVEKWQSQGYPVPADWEKTPIKPSKELWGGYENVED